MRKQGEHQLKDALLRTTHYFEEDVLHDKSANVIMVSSEFVMDVAEWYKDRINENPFSDVLPPSAKVGWVSLQQVLVMDINRGME